MVQDAGYTAVRDVIADAHAAPAACENSQVRKPLELVTHRLGLHADRLGQLRDGQIPGASQGVEEAQAGVVGQDLKQGGKATRLFRSEERPVLQGGLGDA
jgi:hypothetical protein